jgi:hypothetical protein
MQAWGLPGKACLCIGRVYQAGEFSKGAKEPEDSEGLVETEA